MTNIPLGIISKQICFCFIAPMTVVPLFWTICYVPDCMTECKILPHLQNCCSKQRHFESYSTRVFWFQLAPLDSSQRHDVPQFACNRFWWYRGVSFGQCYNAITIGWWCFLSISREFFALRAFLSKFCNRPGNMATNYYVFTCYRSFWTGILSSGLQWWSDTSNIILKRN